MKPKDYEEILKIVGLSTIVVGVLWFIELVVTAIFT